MLYFLILNGSLISESTDGVKKSMQYAIVEYYNVKFFLVFEREEDISKFWYLNNRIKAGDKLYMRDIYFWCIGHRIRVMTKFEYLKDMPITANIWNYYSYWRAKGDYKKLKRKYIDGVYFNNIK